MRWWLADVGVLVGIAVAAHVIGPRVRRRARPPVRGEWLVGLVPPQRVERPAPPVSVGDEAEAWLAQQ